MNFLSSITDHLKATQQNSISLVISPSDKDPTSKSSQDTSKFDEKTVGISIQQSTDEIDASGVARIEAAQAVWGKNGKYLLWAGLAMMMTVFELDNSTVYNYKQYAASSFDKLSLIATLSTASTIISAVVKPPIAKVSDVIGRGETYIFTVTCYVLSYILCAKASSFGMYAVGTVLYSLAQSGTQILDQVKITSISGIE